MDGQVNNGAEAAFRPSGMNLIYYFPRGARFLFFRTHDAFERELRKEQDRLALGQKQIQITGSEPLSYS